MDAPARTLPLGPALDVGRRLADLRAWTAAWQAEDRQLRQRLDGLDPNRRADVLLGSQSAACAARRPCGSRGDRSCSTPRRSAAPASPPCARGWLPSTRA